MTYIHKMNFFDKQYNVVDFGFIDLSNEEIAEDYLSLSSNIFTFPKILNIMQGHFAICGEFQGVVTSVAYIDDKTEVTIAPLLSLLDVDILYPTSESDVILMLTSLINRAYGSDVTTRLTGILIEDNTTQSYFDSSFVEAELPAVVNIYDLIIKLFKQYEVYINIEINIVAKTITFSFNRNAVQVIARLEKPIVLDYELVISAQSKGITTVFCIWSEQPNTIISNYALEKKTALGKPHYIFVSAETEEEFERLADIQSDEITSIDGDNYITATVEVDSLVFPPLNIGKRVKLLHRGVAYDTVVTKKVSQGGAVTYTFGNVRLNLTDILKQRR